ncbi:MAG: phosphomannomutase/phosphoglucomutase [Syntrophomonadaceae bacterium]|nr:phosphomannomutase/phosphoglucomutase [Syntrophomonadaceae bacterium]
MINPNIFRLYDIRGIVDQDLTEDAVYKIARALAAQAAQRGWNKMLLGRDNRLSSPRLREITVQALLDSGCEVLDLGVVVTPIFYFAARHLNVNAGLMITASHNAAEFNGFKMLLGETTIYGDEIQEIRRRAQNSDFVSGSSGSLREVDVIDDYMEMIKGKIQLGPKLLKVVVDCGSGTASLFAPRLFRELGCEVVELYCESDPSFPYHHPDPVAVENCQDMIKLVKQEEADLGIGLDGDGDRLGVVDREGNIIWGDMLMILFWREILPQYPGAECIVEVKCSQSLIDEINRLGGKPLLYKTGHSLIKGKMRETGAVFTGEMSGHLFFADEYYGYDDALYAAARLLRILSHSDQDLTGLLADINKYYATPEIRVKSSDEDKFQVVEQVLQHFRRIYKVLDVDGARILFPGGWGLVRASNTGPELIVRCEGNTPEALDQISAELFAFLTSLGINIV